MNGNNKNSSFHNNKACSINRWLFSIFLLITSVSVFVPFVPTMPAAGLDPSWVYGMNQAVSQGLRIGRDIVFTFGPYASIYTKSFHPATDGIMIWGSLYFGLSFSLAVFLNFKESSWYLQFIILIVLASVSYSTDALLYYYPLLVGTYIFKLTTSSTEASSKARRYLLSAILVFPFGLLPLIKGSLLVVCIVVSIFLSLLYCLERDLKGAILIYIAPAIASILFWIFAGQPLNVLPSYFLSVLPIISGYAEAMSIAGDVWEVFFYLAGASLLLIVIFFEINAKISKKIILLLIFAMILFVSFKGGFVRHDAHAVLAGSIILLAALLVNSFGRTCRASFALFIAAFVWVYVDSNHVNTNSHQFLDNITATYTNAFMGLSSRISGKGKLVQDFDHAIASLRAKSDFPALDGTVDIYSYDQSYLIASGNKWDPRPIFQSYSAYTPTLVEENKAHLLGPDKPDNLIFRIQPIDNRVPSIEDGASWPVILANYEPSKLDNGFLFLKKRALGVNIHEFIVSKEKRVLGDVVDLPHVAGEIFVKIDIRLSLLGKIFNALFKPSELVITVNMVNGAVLHYRIIPGMARTGFLLSPFIETTDEFGLLYLGGTYLESKKVRSISIASKDGKKFWNPEYGIEFIAYDVPPDPNILGIYEFSKPELRRSNSIISAEDKCEGNIDVINGISPAPIDFRVKSLLNVNGWLVTSVDKGLLPESVYLVLFGREGRTYFIKTEHILRPDVGAYFKNNQLDASGFSTVADVSKLSGYYDLGLAYKERGELKLCPKFNIRAEINAEANLSRDER